MLLARNYYNTPAPSRGRWKPRLRRALVNTASHMKQASRMEPRLCPILTCRLASLPHKALAGDNTSDHIPAPLSHCLVVLTPVLLLSSPVAIPAVRSTALIPVKGTLSVSPRMSSVSSDMNTFSVRCLPVLPAPCRYLPW